ncbi:MAM domain-containing glycosylphosphatidylinositol anchor protein 1-like [Branchiostoma floridae x Branchiostoma belcheri]
MAVLHWLLVCLFVGFAAADSTCDFDSDLCGYNQDTADDFDWTRDSSGTPSVNTGPTADHTTGTSSGLYGVLF